MQIELHPVKVRDVVAGYEDDGEGGVVGYGGLLNIRPPYQREFVYKQAQRDAVIDTVFKGFPLNVFYWVENEDGRFEILDGQQRTISIAQYAAGDFAVDVGGNLKGFFNLTEDERERFLDYELLVYRCKGDDSEKLDWFRTINIAGEKLEDQELLNATYYGPWLTSAKAIFSRTGGPAAGLAGRYLQGEAIRQKYLETALRWISYRDGLDNHAAYMAQHQHDDNAQPLWSYFRDVINWVDDTFPKYRSLMKGQPWGPLYEAHHDEERDPSRVEKQLAALVQDKEVTSKRGIYPYVLTGDTKYLSLRAFDEEQRLEMYERQQGRCANGTKCKHPGNEDGQHVFPIGEMDADHVVPWSKGGKTHVDNGQMLCISCNRRKGDL